MYVSLLSLSRCGCVCALWIMSLPVNDLCANWFDQEKGFFLTHAHTVEWLRYNKWHSWLSSKGLSSHYHSIRSLPFNNATSHATGSKRPSEYSALTRLMDKFYWHQVATLFLLLFLLSSLINEPRRRERETESEWAIHWLFLTREMRVHIRMQQDASCQQLDRNQPLPLSTTAYCLACVLNWWPVTTSVVTFKRPGECIFCPHQTEQMYDWTETEKGRNSEFTRGAQVTRWLRALLYMSSLLLWLNWIKGFACYWPNCIELSSVGGDRFVSRCGHKCEEESRILTGTCLQASGCVCVWEERKRKEARKDGQEFLSIIPA